MVKLVRRRQPPRPQVRALLILVHTPNGQALDDLFELRELIALRAPDIGVVVLGNTPKAALTVDALPDLPRLFVSFRSMPYFKPARGAVHAGRTITKDKEQELLEAAGLPVPPAVVLAPGCRLDEAVLGDLVVEKPLDLMSTSNGKWVHLRRTREVVYTPAEEYPLDHPGRKAPMIVQRFVDTGPFATSHRVLTLYGQPLYALRFTSNIAMPDHASVGAALGETSVASNVSDRRVEMFDDKDILRLARRVHEALPETPLKGVDILRDVRDGSLWVIEFNAGGNSWGFSSRGGRVRSMIQSEVPVDDPRAQVIGRDILKAQFNGFERAADILITKTRTQAR